MPAYCDYSDEHLLRAVQNADERAFYELYERYHHAVYLNVMRMLRSGPESEDIVQEVFYRFWQKRQSIAPDRSLGGWLFMVSYHLSIDHLRLKLKDRRLLDYYYPEPESAIIDAADMRAAIIDEAIGRLSPQKRKVFELCKVQGKTYEKAAAELGISRNTVSDYLKEAMRSIRLHAQQYEYPHLAVAAILLHFLK